MIVYNVGRRFFAKKEDAEKERVGKGLKPAHTLTIEILHRDDLVDLLNALSEPPRPAGTPSTVPVALVERAYIDPHLNIPDCVPEFLLRDHGLTRKPK